MSLIIAVFAIVIVSGFVLGIMATAQPKKPDKAPPFEIGVWYHDPLEVQDAWRFWDWCNAVTRKHLEENPPAEQFTITRNQRGMWDVRTYTGVLPCGAHWTALRYSAYPMTPPPIPGAHHHFALIGPTDGFLTRADAEKFVKGYATADAATLRLNHSLKPTESKA